MMTGAPPARSSRSSGHVRIEDVARSAGVSAQTVSRHLRNPGQVSPLTAARISSAIEATGYMPNLLAGALASNRSRVVAILVPTIANPVHAAPVQGLSDVMRASGYEVLVGTTSYDPGTEQALVAAFLGRRVDGIVLTGAATAPETAQMLARSRVPTVQLWELPARPVDMAVGLDNTAVGVTVAAHLASRGYRRLAVVRHAAASDTRSAARATGFIEETRRLGLPSPLLLTADKPAEMAQAPALLAELRGAQAVFCVGDQLAIGLVLACQRLGISVPSDLAVVGVGDSDLASLITPPLTTVRIPRYGLGRAAAELLLGRFTGQEDVPTVIDVGFELVIRGSS